MEQSPVPSVIRFKNACILTESKAFCPLKKCRTYVNRTIFALQWRHSLHSNHCGPLYFLLVPVSFRCPLQYVDWRLHAWVWYVSRRQAVLQQYRWSNSNMCRWNNNWIKTQMQYRIKEDQHPQAAHGRGATPYTAVCSGVPWTIVIWSGRHSWKNGSLWDIARYPAKLLFSMWAATKLFIWCEITEPPPGKLLVFCMWFGAFWCRLVAVICRPPEPVHL